MVIFIYRYKSIITLIKGGINLGEIILKFIENNKLMLLTVMLLIFSIFNRKKDITLVKKDKKGSFRLVISNNENI